MMNKKGSKTAVEPIYNPSDVKAIADQLKREDAARGQPAYVIWVLCVSGGYRIDDVLTLRVAQVCGKNKQVRDQIEIREEKTGKTQKRKVTNEVRGPLQDYINGLDWTKVKYQSYLFESPRRCGKPYTYQWITGRIKDAAAMCGIKQRVTTHSMRKTFAYTFYMKYKDDKRVFASPDDCLNFLSREILKHASKEITMRYIGVDLVQDKIDRLLGDVSKQLL